MDMRRSLPAICLRSARDLPGPERRAYGMAPPYLP